MFSWGIWMSDNRNKSELLGYLMKEWREKHNKNGQSKFIYDGIVDISEYGIDCPKICFILKECYFEDKDIEDYEKHKTDKKFSYNWTEFIRHDELGYSYNLVENICNKTPWYMWWKVKHITKVILQGLGYNIPDEKVLRKIAVIDIKKSCGEKASAYKDILNYSIEDNELLLRELDIVEPDIIVCAGTLEYCSGLIKIKKEIGEYKSKTGLYKIYADDKNRLVIHTYHPAAPNLCYEKFENEFLAHKEYLNKL